MLRQKVVIYPLSMATMENVRKAFTLQIYPLYTLGGRMCGGL